MRLVQWNEGGAPDDSSDDDQLLLSIGNGDRRAFRRLMDKHVRNVVGIAQRVTGNAHDAEEIMQEVFLKTWTMAPRWNPDGGAQFATWLYRVTLNASLDRSRRQAFAPLEDAGDPADSAPGGLDLAISLQCRTMIAQALATLPERQRAALSLYYYGDVSAAQAAEVLKMSRPALEALLVRGKRALKKTLAKLGVTHLGDVV